MIQYCLSYCQQGKRSLEGDGTMTSPQLAADAPHGSRGISKCWYRSIQPELKHPRSYRSQHLRGTRLYPNSFVRGPLEKERKRYLAGGLYNQLYGQFIEWVEGKGLSAPCQDRTRQGHAGLDPLGFLVFKEENEW
jgi:hypothetical protein